MLVQAEWHNAQSETPWPSESWGRRPAQPDRIQVQLGFTMFEKMHLDSGQVTNASLADYKIPGIWDVPAAMMNEALDAFQHNGPFGAKGAGESATLCLSPGPSCSVRRKCASSVLHLAKSKNSFTLCQCHVHGRLTDRGSSVAAWRSSSATVIRISGS